MSLIDECVNDGDGVGECDDGNDHRVGDGGGGGEGVPSYCVGVLSARGIIGGWRWAILGITLFCAMATPAADVVSMFILAAPMVVLYFAAWAIAWVHDRRVAKRLQREFETESSQ